MSGDSSSSGGEEFHDSHDRILSSSNSSASESDSDTRLPSPYDVWISAPSSVHERRRRLLHQMGLSADSDTQLPINPAPGAISETSPESDGDDRSCKIKNLDDGREFVVRDPMDVPGVLDEVSEVATGRQLTIEEFEMCVGRSPIVQELMRRSVADSAVEEPEPEPEPPRAVAGPSAGGRWKKRTGWLRSIKNMAGTVVARRNTEERDTLPEKGIRMSISGDDSPDTAPPVCHGPVPIRVRQSGKSYKELTSLSMSQEIKAHGGSIWCIRFSLDGQFLASAGEDRVIHVRKVAEGERKGELIVEPLGENVNCNPFLAVIGTESPEPGMPFNCVEVGHWERKRRARAPSGRRFMSSDHVMVPEHVFVLSEKPICSFKGHLDDVLDLSWSKSQYLLSSSMDKTVRLWHMSNNACLRTFSHSDYVTCIQFNPVDDRYFISGSLDEKVRIWSIPDRRVVDWNDLHEMITAVCYTPDGQGALVGSHKGSCHRYDTSDNKLHHKGQIDLQNKKKKCSSRKITGFQFAPGSSSEVLITAADSRILVVDGVEPVHKFKGFRNTSSQISASLSANGRYVISASEDSQVYVWRYDADPRPTGSKAAITTTQSYEHFYCRDVTVAVSWPVFGNRAKGGTGIEIEIPLSTNPFGDRVSATWPEEKLLGPDGTRVQSKSAWGMVIVTAARGGEITTFQNFGFPVRI